jgi:hypothetical protein
MGVSEESRQAWAKHKAATQAELGEILLELERLGLEKQAALARTLAISPENHFGCAGDWEGGIMDLGKEFSSATNIPDDLRSRLQRLLKTVPFSG